MNITKEANLAAKWILDGKVIAYPTEGVWGIGGLDLTKNIKTINSAKKNSYKDTWRQKSFKFLETDR